MEEKISLILDWMNHIKFHCDMRYCDRESCKKQVGDLIRLHFWQDSSFDIPQLSSTQEHDRIYKIKSKQGDLLDHWDKILELRKVTDDSISVELDDHGFLWIRDWYPLSLDDARVILKHKIPKDMFYEYADMKTWNCRSERVKKKIDKDPKFILITSLEDFYLYFWCE